MKCKELWLKYLDNFSAKVAYDIILSCKIGIAAVFVIYTVLMYTTFIPSEFTGTILSRIMFSIVSGVGVTIFTMPLFLGVMVIAGFAVRFMRDCCAGGCFLCSWVRERLGTSNRI
ncbi:hypothetical protein Dacet_0212 [Denitrovibrio acetiphilus DSM 12809]|uniref:Uncharacterized protein n=1 Tax=Denitrovibrio acetiphilus (strain DSM 12809 / NBRC 114555 / N2460) TaxID=522772 RepID=D4H239_DENA2|nr:hypothetical protein [Denitrovibrio acetiphilus]ADD67016.1 hypothetical protein Dacet_0212 [Denitrovibrio acetiphilus DSM 12809]